MHDIAGINPCDRQRSSSRRNRRERERIDGPTVHRIRGLKFGGQSVICTGHVRLGHRDVKWRAHRKAGCGDCLGYLRRWGGELGDCAKIQSGNIRSRSRERDAVASVKNVRLIELLNSALTVRVPELVCPCAHAIPDVRIKPASDSVDRILLYPISRLSAI